MRQFISTLLFFLSLSLYGQITIQDSIFHDGVFRKYITRVPASYDATASHELVFVLHGGTGNANGMMLFTGFNQVSDTANFIIVYPEGIFTGLNLGGNPGHHWADGRMTTMPDVQGVDDVGFISDLIDTISSEYTIDSNKVYAAGISNGGFMVQRLACELSHKIAAVATVAATFPDSLIQVCHNTNPISILIMNGTNDAFVPTYTGGMVGSAAGGSVIPTEDMIDIWLINNNCSKDIDSIELPDISTADQSTVTKYTYNGCMDFSCVLHYKIFGGGHTWPGEIFHVPFTGTTNEDINATVEIWNFFHSKSKNMSSITSDSNEDLSIKVFPNPFDDSFSIGLPPSNGIHTLELLDLSGRSLWTISNNRYSKEGILSNLGTDLNNGMYLLNCYSDNHILLKTTKVLKVD